MTEEQLQLLIRGCINNDRQSQKMLYQAFYGFAMSICLRYANNRYDAAEVVNEGFFKIYTHMEKYDQQRPFKAWLSKIMHNVSVDYYRSNIKSTLTDELDGAETIEIKAEIEDKLAYEDLLAIIQRLPAAYRTVFNLFAIDGYTHDEIAEMLNISSGTSKSNLFKARQKLQQMLVDFPHGLDRVDSQTVLTVTINQSME
ncbi:RNA polymerase sigma factor [Solitalea canadensis]|uniref:RNA polymerase sigma factor, sigma-70 family n=1 Tax=Solitalea canadensis (strain ATCC 29591 / DSM 3403 / JCM 21819 / LMG 8368 / NBRC 15130 / NCIMB 12057 / USAM 9D) TaxID=929556 RepID=H8KSJ4_SOLCM|nr:sigma-70 family RNA polymerase sigma factor [Solitalea canadensis]AFD08545.1 RNA polymerase sigma factor, sigma-70 family [Solitalea canadensis DSM 3403]